MPQNSSRFRPQADALESRMVLSAVLTPAGYGAASNRIGQAVARLAATGNVGQAEVALARAMQSIPDGDVLLPTLDAALTTNRVTTRAMMAEVNSFIREYVASGDIVVPNAALRRKIGVVASTTPPSSLPISIVVPITSPQTTTGVTAPATLPSSYSVRITNSVNSDLNVSFTQVVNGTPIQLTGVFIRSGATATFVPVIPVNSSPITVSAQSQSVGYWEITAPTNFSQLDIQYMYGRCYFYFK